MKSFAVTTNIAAPAETVWAILTDLPGWMSWNPTVERVSGQIAPGEKVTVYTKIANGRAFPVRVAAFEPPFRMVWSAGMPLGLFRGTRTFTLTPDDSGGVTFAMDEKFTGPLAGLIGRSIPDLQPDFETFAASLKDTAEKRAT
jgi:hypothetical protein